MGSRKSYFQMAFLLFVLMAPSESEASSHIYRFESNGGSYLELLFEFTPGYIPPGFSDFYEPTDGFDDFYEASLLGAGQAYYFFNIELIDTDIDPCDIVIDPDAPCSFDSDIGFGWTSIVASDPGMQTQLRVPFFIDFHTPSAPVEPDFFPTGWEPGILIEDPVTGFTMELVSVRPVPLPASLPLLCVALCSFLTISRKRV